MNSEADESSGRLHGPPPYAAAPLHGLPLVPGMRTATIETCLQNLALVSNRIDTARKPSDELLVEMRVVVDRFVSEGLPYDTGHDGRRFDLVELRNFVNVADQRFGDPFWREYAMPLGKRLMLEAFSDPDTDKYLDDSCASAAKALAPRRFRLCLSRTYNPRFLKKSGICRLRLPIPLEDSTLTDLSVALTAPVDHEIIRCSRTTGRLDVTVDPNQVSGLTCAATCEFECQPDRRVPGGKLDRREGVLALGASEGLIRLTPAVRELAEKLVGAETEAMKVVRVFWDYLHGALNIGTLRYSQLDPADPLISILNIRWADCHLAAAVLVGLCRSRGLPARIVGGYMLKHARPGYHYWAEVWIAERGWVPFDPVGFAVTRPGDRSPWRDIFFGRVDYRARVECLPQLFTGLPGFRIPAAWHLNVSHIEGGTRTCLEDSSSGEAVFSEDVGCERLP
jgi:hypothetical protein